MKQFIVLINVLYTLILMSVFSFASAQSTITLVNLDGAGEGFNDNSAPFPGQTGNAGGTLGQQRLNVFQAAADYWEARLNSPVPIRVGINMDPQDCDAGSAVLGSAGPNSVFRDFTNAPLSNTWFVEAVANSLAGSDLGASNDLGATFNSSIDNNNNCLSGINWWYGIGSPAPSGTISLFDTVLHEIGHGIGVLSLVNSQTGELFSGFNDAYSYHLYDETSNQFWRNMSNAQRAASAINNGNLVWRGPNADGDSCHLTSGLNNGHIRMYAPNPLRLGSSVSHWDTALFPDELMEPFATATSDDRSTIQLLRDVGWDVNLIAAPIPGIIEFTSPSFGVFEDSGPATILVRRTAGCDGAVSVLVNSSDISATGGGVDYNSIVNQQLNWADGESGTKTIEVTITDDGDDEEGNEQASFSLSGITGGATIGTSPTTLTIRDPDEDDISLMVVPAIAAAAAQTTIEPPTVINPQWFVATEVCCPTSSATFSVTGAGSTLRSTAPSCTTPAPPSAIAEATARNHSFSFSLASSGCGTIPGNFNFAFAEATRYLFLLELVNNALQLTVFSQPISGQAAENINEIQLSPENMTYEKTIQLSVSELDQIKKNMGFQRIGS